MQIFHICKRELRFRLCEDHSNVYFRVEHLNVLQLVVFDDADVMTGVALEGLVAYRTDTHRLYFRDNIGWKAVRVSPVTHSKVCLYSQCIIK